VSTTDTVVRLPIGIRWTPPWQSPGRAGRALRHPAEACPAGNCSNSSPHTTANA